MSSAKSAGTMAQRRGKQQSLRPEPTILVESVDGVLMRNDQLQQQPPQLEASGGTVLVNSGAGGGPNIAVVKRRSCGTGPFDKNWLNMDCCGLICAMFTYGLLLYGVYAVCFVLVPPWMSYRGLDNVRFMSMFGHIHRTLFCLLTGMAMASHFKAMTTDPGAVPPDAKPLPDPDDNEADIEEASFVNKNGGSTVFGGDVANQQQPLVTPQRPKQPLRLCRRCKSFKPQRAHHCSVCRRCIIKMDHHCPWVNNCVGIGNHKYFLLFIFYTFLVCCYALSLIITRFSTCMGVRSHTANGRHVSCLDHPADLLKILGLLIEAILFGMFTSCMMFDQYEVIHSKMTHIDRLKGADVGGALAGVTEVFGVGKPRGGTAASSPDNFTKFRWDWLLPFGRVCFPETLQDEVLGFCRPVKLAPARTSSSRKGTAPSVAPPASTSTSEVELGGSSNHSKRATLGDNV